MSAVMHRRVSALEGRRLERSAARDELTDDIVCEAVSTHSATHRELSYLYNVIKDDLFVSIVCQAMGRRLRRETGSNEVDLTLDSWPYASHPLVSFIEVLSRPRGFACNPETTRDLEYILSSDRDQLRWAPGPYEPTTSECTVASLVLHWLAPDPNLENLRRPLDRWAEADDFPFPDLQPASERVRRLAAAIPNTTRAAWVAH